MRNIVPDLLLPIARGIYEHKGDFYWPEALTGFIRLQYLNQVIKLVSFQNAEMSCVQVVTTNASIEKLKDFFCKINNCKKMKVVLKTKQKIMILLFQTLYFIIYFILK